MNTPFKGVEYPWKVFKIPLSLVTLCKSILMHTHKLQRWTNSIEEPHIAGPLPPVKELCGVKGGFPQCPLSVVGRVIRNFCHISLEREWSLFRSVLASTLIKFPTPKSTMLAALNGTDIDNLDSNKRYYF